VQYLHTECQRHILEYNFCTYIVLCFRGLSIFLYTFSYYTFTFPFFLSVLSFIYEGVSKSFRTYSVTKYTLTTIYIRWEATQRIMAAKLTRLTHEIAIQLHLVAESCAICSSRSRRPVRKLLDTPSYFFS
jgi:hypothetical protein